MANNRAGNNPAPEVEAENPCSGTSGFLMVMMAVLTMMILIDPEMRFSVANMTNVILFPLIGFDFNGDGVGDLPVLTIVSAAIITGTINTVLRHINTDWIKQAEIQEYMSAYNKELRKATADNNQNRVKQLEKLQPEIMKMQADLMNSQMKQMFFTMFIAIAIFTWLWANFIAALDYPYFSVPWAPMVNLKERSFLYLNNWILLYSMFSIVFSQLLTRALKILSFRHFVEVEEKEEEEEFEQARRELEKELSQYSKEGMNVTGYKDRLARAKRQAEKGDTIGAYIIVEELQREARANYTQFKKAMELYRRARKLIKKAGKLGISVEELEGAWRDTQKAMDRGNYKDAAFFAQRVEGLYDAYRDKYDDIITEMHDVENDIKDLESMGVDVSKAEEMYEEARKALKNSDFTTARTMIKRASNRLSQLRKEGGRLKDAAGAVDKLLKEMKALNMPDYERFSKTYGEVMALKGTDPAEYSSRLLSLKADMEAYLSSSREANENLNIAKMLLLSANDSVNKEEYESRIERAESLLSSGNYTEALSEARAIRADLEKVNR